MWKLRRGSFLSNSKAGLLKDGILLPRKWRLRGNTGRLWENGAAEVPTGVEAAQTVNVETMAMHRRCCAWTQCLAGRTQCRVGRHKVQTAQKCELSAIVAASHSRNLFREAASTPAQLMG